MNNISSILVGLVLLHPSAAFSCEARDFLNIEIERENASLEVSAILNSYDDLSYSDATKSFKFEDMGTQVVYHSQTNRTASEMLSSPTIGDQFAYVYPLDFDLNARETPWYDPGRLRNEEFFQQLYFMSEAQARDTLITVSGVSNDATFLVTEKNDVACQLKAVLQELGDEFPEVFLHIGGSYNWRKISGTNRLSVHSYGAAIDLNSKIGGYWKWSGQSAGEVGAFDNQIPKEVVQAFERFGFIWGGKWHHYDGMHFEYRPELVLYARLIKEN